MAFSTLDAIRTGGLNYELGLTADNDDTWGTTTQRNFFLQRAFAKLWPEMGRARRYALTIVANQTEYDLTALNKELREITAITVYDTTGLEIDAVRSWSLYWDEDDATPAARLTIPELNTSDVVYLYGYAPYIVPANGSASCDLPPELEHVVCAGARVEAYRAKLNQYANYPRLANENRANAISAAEVIELMRTATAEFNGARKAFAKENVPIRRAIRSVR